MNKKYISVVFQSFAGLLVVAAVTTQFVLHLQSGANVVNFFSYFTNLSNLFAAIVLLIGAVLTAQEKTSRLFDVIRGASVVYMAVVGIVFSLLLSGVDLGILQPWVNDVLHYIMPVLVVAYWFISPPKSRLGLKVIPVWLIIPAAYLAYSLIRGSVVGWYPYPFLSPGQSGGYGGVALYSLLILVIFVGFSLVVRWAGNQRIKKSSK